MRINDRRAPRRHGPALRVRSGAAGQSVFIALDKLDKIGRDGVVAELRRPATPTPAHRPHAGRSYASTASARSLTACAGRRGPWHGGAFAALARIIEAVGAAGRGPLRHRLRPHAGARAWATTPGRSSSSRTASFPSGSIAGGGRYDGMIGRLLGRDVPATGFSIGFERVVTSWAGWSAGRRREERRMALVFDEAAPEPGRAVRAAQTLRSEGYLVALERQARNAGAQAAALEKQGYDGVATVTTEGRASIQWFADRARRQPGSGA